MAELGMDHADIQAPEGTGKVDDLAAALKDFSLSPAPEPGTGGPGGDATPKTEPRTYAPEEVVDLVTLPAETMYALTGSDIWLLEESEKKILAEKTAKALSLMMQIEPKWFIGISLAAYAEFCMVTPTLTYYMNGTTDNVRLAAMLSGTGTIYLSRASLTGYMISR